ncbi:MAG: hypothetical protein IJR36_03195 [Lachnospiraceae bacterium]|nr:hypothetical protein [Lachnospiraceae bacterium]
MSAASAHWEEKYGDWYYIDEKGNYTTGWLELSGKWYYFDKNGVMVTGEQKIGSSWYRFADSGKMITGWYKDYIYEYDDNDNLEKIEVWYYYQASGKRASGWQQLSGKWYYFITESEADYYDGFSEYDGVMWTGWWEIGDKWYYFLDNGAMATGWVEVGYDDEYGGYTSWGYLDSNGAGHNGWLEYKGKWYYVESGEVIQNRKWKINGKTYGFDKNGAMLTGWVWMDSNLYDYDYAWHYFKSNGVMTTGWLELSGKWYYFTSNGQMLTGVQSIGGSYYRFKDSGQMMTGWVQAWDDYYSEYEWYYYKSNGKRATGWEKVGNNWYYFSPDHDGYMYFNGYYYINDKRYWFKEDGPLITGWYYLHWSDTDSFWVYCTSSGVGYDGWLQEGKDWYYIEEGEPAVGLWKIDGIRYAFGDNCKMIKNAFYWEDNDHDQWPYHFDSDGKGTNGKVRYNSYISYLYENGEPIVRYID